MNQTKSTSLFQRFFLNDRNILALISINAVVIFFQGFKDTGYEQLMTYLDDIITLLFLIEVIVKSSHYGWKEYLRSSWNKFDVLLILFSIPSILVHVIPGIENYINVSFLLVFRVFRVFKFFRFIQFFPQVEHIFRSISEALKASFMVLVGFFVVVFIMAILSTFFFQEAAPSYFSNPLRSYYSIFQIFTVEGWNSITDGVIAEAKEEIGMGAVGEFFTTVYFIVLLILGGVFGLSIVNSIFVDAMVSDHDETEQQFQEVEDQLVVLTEKMDRMMALLEQNGLSDQLKDKEDDDGTNN
jgi:voltage-gated sodium channel